MITDLWYKNAVVYSLDLETFMDGNGDGCGDFHGLMQRLDYLDSLGIDVIWLAPYQPSPNRDNGYDISDFYGVDPRHGSSGEFVEFMNQANKRGIGVIIDLVVNHTSDKHPWFQAARRDAQSPLFICGGGVITAGAEPQLLRLAERLSATVATTISGKGSIAETHPLAAGEPSYWAAFGDAGSAARHGHCHAET